MQDKLLLYYKLNVIAYLTASKEPRGDEEQEWGLRFISDGGYEKIISLLFHCIREYSDSSPRTDKEIIKMLISLLLRFLPNCYGNTRNMTALALFQDEAGLDDKCEFLHLGKQINGKSLVVEEVENVYQLTRYSKG